eukprot:s1897_g2.t1
MYTFPVGLYMLQHHRNADRAQDVARWPGRFCFDDVTGQIEHDCSASVAWQTRVGFMPCWDSPNLVRSDWTWDGSSKGKRLTTKQMCSHDFGSNARVGPPWELQLKGTHLAGRLCQTSARFPSFCKDLHYRVVLHAVVDREADALACFAVEIMFLRMPRSGATAEASGIMVTRAGDQPRRPGAALAAALCAAAAEHAEAHPVEKLRHKEPDDAARTERSAVPLAIRRLEQQLEVERRQMERKLEKLEKRVEEVACTSAASGRWAELQGHVDGLADAVQSLIRGQLPQGGPPPTASEATGNRVGTDTAVWKRFDIVEVKLQQLEESRGKFIDLQSQSDKVTAQVADLDSKLLQLVGRLAQVERGAPHVSEHTSEVLGPSLQGIHEAMEQLALRVQHVEDPKEPSGLAETCRQVCVQMDLLRNEVEEHTSMLEDQVAELDARMQTFGSEIQDLVQTQEARLQVDSVGERALRLALRAQRAVNAQDFSEDAREMREELTEMSEDLTSLWQRVQSSELGLDSMAEAVGRICEELRQLKSRSVVTQPASGSPASSRKLGEAVRDSRDRDSTQAWILSASAMEGAPPGANFSVGQRVFVSNRAGTVRFCGQTEFAGGVWVGIQLDDPVGRNDGTVKDVVYFTCPPNHGIFVRPAQVTLTPMATGRVSTSSPGSPSAKATSPTSSPTRQSRTAPAESKPKPEATEAKSESPKSDKPEKPEAEAKATAAPPAPETKTAVKPEEPQPPAAPAMLVPATPVKAPETTTPRVSQAEPVVSKTSEASAEVSKPAAQPPTEAAAPSAAAAPAGAAPQPTQPAAPAAAAPPPAAPSAAAPPPVPAAQPNQTMVDLAKAGASWPICGLVSQTDSFNPAARSATTEKALAAAEAAKEAEARAIKLTAQLAEEAADLQAKLSKVTADLEEVQSKSQGAREQAEQAEAELERAKAAAAAATAAAAAAQERKAAEIRLQAEEAAKNQGTLEKERAAFEADSLSALPQDDGADIPDPQQLSEASSGSLRAVVERLQEQLAKELKEKELLDIEAEELALRLEEVKDTTEWAADNDAWTEQVQVEWHREALWEYYKAHRAEVVRLRHRAAERSLGSSDSGSRDRVAAALAKALERAQQQALQLQSKSTGTEDASMLKRAVEQLTQQNDGLASALATKTKLVEEQRSLQTTGLEMLETEQDLEVQLCEELQSLQGREEQLEQLALQLCKIRRQMQSQRLARSAEVARLETRLQMLRSGGKAAGAAASASPAAIEAETLEVHVNCREAIAAAEAWMSCLPSQVRDDAELGVSFHSLCALHRCFRKACILSRSIHEHFIADAALAVLQDAASMNWLCSISLASTQLAYAALGVLGCLYTTDVERYCLLVRNAAFVSCAGEASLDAALAALQRIFRLDKAAETEEVLAALRAHGAQLLSLLKALFKDLQFASWQRAGCAVEALRMACASALYASADAGGSQRKRWQELYDQSNRLFNRLQAACPDGAELLEIGPSEERHPKRRDSEDTDEEDEDEDEELEEDGEHRNQTTAQHVGLTQLLLDGLLRQALALHPLSQHEPVSDMDTLQRTFSHAETQLELLSEIFAAAPVAGAQKKERPWEKARSRKRSSLEVAEQAAQPALEQATKGLSKVQVSLETLGDRLAKAKQEMQEAEKQFGAARIQSERRALMLASVAQMQKQAKAGTQACELLEEELRRQTEECNQMEDAMTEAKARCRELHHRLNELERRIMRRYCNDVSPEDVLALRRAVARQSAEIRELQARQHRWRDIGLLENGGAAGHSEEDVGNLWLELQTFREGLLQEHSRPKIATLDEPEPEAAPESQKARLQDLGKEMKALRERITDCAKQSSPVYDSVALTRFLRCEKGALQFFSVTWIDAKTSRKLQDRVVEWQ